MPWHLGMEYLGAGTDNAVPQASLVYTAELRNLIRIDSVIKRVVDLSGIAVLLAQLADRLTSKNLSVGGLKHACIVWASGPNLSGVRCIVWVVPEPKIWIALIGLLDACFAESVTGQRSVNVDIFDTILGVLGNCLLNSCIQSKTHLVEFGADCRCHICVLLAIRLRVCRTCKSDVVAKGCFIVEELSIPCHIQFELVASLALLSFRHNLPNESTNIGDKGGIVNFTPGIRTLVIARSKWRSATRYVRLEYAIEQDSGKVDIITTYSQCSHRWFAKPGTIFFPS